MEAKHDYSPVAACRKQSAKATNEDELCWLTEDGILAKLAINKLRLDVLKLEKRFFLAIRCDAMSEFNAVRAIEQASRSNSASSLKS
jgi:hypothetical protein